MRSRTGLNEQFQFSREGAADELRSAITGLGSALVGAPGILLSESQSTMPERPQETIEGERTKPSVSHDNSSITLPLDQSYYVFRNGVEGPFTREQLEARLASGELPAEMLACAGQSGKWRPLRETLGITE